jgi:phosphoribosylformylglycinamidine synthase PurS subunit
MKIGVTVLLKDEIVDASGKVLTSRLLDMGFQEVRGARVGKFIELDLDTGDEFTATERVKKMSQELLVNANIEDFSIQIVEDKKK